MGATSIGRSVAAVLLVLISLAPVGTVDAADPSDREAELRAVEAAFAKTMADRDHAAFSVMLADETVFFGAEGPIRGKDAVAAAWKRFFDGERAPFSWEPEVAVVLESGTLGLTSGPVRDADGKTIGTFNSIWRRESDGTWRIVLDRGCDCP